MKNISLLRPTALLACTLFLISRINGMTEDIVSIAEKKDCFICGDWTNTIMESVGKNNSVGLVYPNEPAIFATMARAYDDDGNELFNQGTISYYSVHFGEGNGKGRMTCPSDRGITDIMIYFKESNAVDFKHASKILCQDCLDVVVYFVTQNSEWEKACSSSTTSFYLIDFETRRLYGISGSFHRQYIGDYYASFTRAKESNDRRAGTIDLAIFYASTRKPIDNY